MVLPEAIRTIRTAEAVILTQMVAMAREHMFVPARDVETVHAATINERVARLTGELTEDAETYPRLAAYIADLDKDGLVPLADRRLALRRPATVPRGVIERLPATAANTPGAEKVAAAWVWLDATPGRPAGGPHPRMAPRTVLAFDEGLNPEGRLALRDWWRHHLDTAEIATGDPATSGRGGAVTRHVS
ncbi:hypothetical protein LP422_20880 [Janibacter limosus]|uniref:Uncharacterized protein n=1 Tax=Janibacter limosus TaxID=53458 RepID=A0AC61U3X7_9MICO|nr:hypothetical protein [Janibacter limosus]UUZ44724.1 hypothetical protein LP422_20880 [Janibacter limosus]